VLEAAGQRRLEFMLGQSLFTPRDLTRANPDPRDRPYVGWLYGGVRLLQESGQRMLENLELEAGIVGRHAFGKEVQNDWHQLIQLRGAEGWRFQLRDEPGLLLAYERKWRLPMTQFGNVGLDIVPELGASLGNVFTYADAGALVRFGRGLGVDYGPVHLRPSPSGTAWFDGAAARALDGFGWYLYLGAQGRAVGRNIFLDGNSFRDSRSVDKLPFVGDLVAGLSLYCADAVRLDITAMQRSAEFHGQDHQDRFGGVTLSFRFW
jgi:lipid A 3-O-deacylase